MRFACSALLALVIVSIASAADSVNVLQNVRGQVSYQTPGAEAHAIALNASTVLTANDTAMTGDASMGALTLLDSSRILLGQRTRVQVGLFAAAPGGRNTFVIYNGKTRFSIEHPHGVPANYVFKTPTAEIAVRGTLGDISVDVNDGMRLNVYHVGDSSLPVEVQTIYGEHFSLHGGEKLWVRWQQGRLIGRQTRLTKVELNRFSEFGTPSTIDGGMPR